VLELAILGFLHDSPMHGYELKQRLKTLTGHFRPVSDGALYPAINRLEKQKQVRKNREPGENGQDKIVLHLTDEGKSRLMRELASPDDVDISDRNRFFTLLAFLHAVGREEQLAVLRRRFDFLQGGQSFFSVNGSMIRSKDETDPFRLGMTHIAKETTRIEKQWLLDMIAKLEGE